MPPWPGGECAAAVDAERAAERGCGEDRRAACGRGALEVVPERRASRKSAVRSPSSSRVLGASGRRWTSALAVRVRQSAPSSRRGLVEVGRGRPRCTSSGPAARRTTRTDAARPAPQAPGDASADARLVVDEDDDTVAGSEAVPEHWMAPRPACTVYRPM